MDSMCLGAPHQPDHDFCKAVLPSEAHSMQPTFLLSPFIVVRPTSPFEGSLFLLLLSFLKHVSRYC